MIDPAGRTEFEGVLTPDLGGGVNGGDAELDEGVLGEVDGVDILR